MSSPRVVLGNEPADLLLNLPAEGGFAATALLEGDPIDPADALELRFDAGGPWPATITDGTLIRWQLSAAQVTALRDAGATTVALWYIPAVAGDPIVWAAGDVVIR